ncbi:hypothetical protein [Allonocardiopsis opalescens]|uniref:Uncharacterized protein n=1 Tax=Allonocardiopsis opalescens TaxID=1144618 RepID=A0A2T0QDC7_9ACTN|nr:hypothetical protein [Allonocardiopsis opalescens]PRY01956.1 hypothetical protein CLV72_101554 [Allonocardiopsis opalescens]
MNPSTAPVRLTLPKLLGAHYLVAAPAAWPRDPAAIAERIAAELPTIADAGGGPVAGRVRLKVRELNGGHLAAGVTQRLANASLAELRRIGDADRHLLVGAYHRPGWPPLHALVARHVAGAFADRTGGMLLDPLTMLVHDHFAADTWPGRGQLRLMDWICVLDVVGDPEGATLATIGLSRFGLPDLRLHHVPRLLAGPWARLLGSLAQVLADAHWSGRSRGETLRLDPTTISAADVARAESVPVSADAAAQSAPVGFRLTGSDLDRQLWLDLVPPGSGPDDDFSETPTDPAAWSEWLESVVLAVFPPDNW